MSNLRTIAGTWRRPQSLKDSNSVMEKEEGGEQRIRADTQQRAGRLRPLELRAVQHRGTRGYRSQKKKNMQSEGFSWNTASRAASFI